MFEIIVFYHSRIVSISLLQKQILARGGFKFHCTLLAQGHKQVSEFIGWKMSHAALPLFLEAYAGVLAMLFFCFQEAMKSVGVQSPNIGDDSY